MYYLPVVVKHPQGRGMGLPVLCDQMVHAVTSWVKNSLASLEDEGDISLRVLERPHPFSTAMSVGNRALLDANFRNVVTTMVEKTRISPNAMSALVSRYEVVNSNDVER